MLNRNSPFHHCLNFDVGMPFQKPAVKVGEDDYSSLAKLSGDFCKHPGSSREPKWKDLILIVVLLMTKESPVRGI